MYLDGDVPDAAGVDTLVDHDLFDQTVEGGGVQLGDVGILPDGLGPLAGVVDKLFLIGQLLAIPRGPLPELGLLGLGLVPHQVKVFLTDPSFHPVLVEPQDHLVQHLDPFLVLGEGTFQRLPLGALLCGASVGQPACHGILVLQGGLGALPNLVQHQLVEDVVLDPVLGAVVLAVGVVGLAGVDLLGMLGVGGPDGDAWRWWPGWSGTCRTRRI